VSSISYSGPLFPTNVPCILALSDFITSMSDYLVPSLECNTSGTWVFLCFILLLSRVVENAKLASWVGDYAERNARLVWKTLSILPRYSLDFTVGLV
jgi:hypothetical protein